MSSLLLQAGMKLSALRCNGLGIREYWRAGASKRVLDRIYDRSNLISMKSSDMKEHILSAAMDMIALNGFNATGVDAVLKQAGVPKGSFYHYFGTKENFGLELIEKFSAEYDAMLDSFFINKSVPPVQRIYNYLEHGISQLSENSCSRGCLIGNLGQELADKNERFRVKLAEIFLSWQGRFEACLQEARAAGQIDAGADPRSLAQFILSGWEGAILQAKVMRSKEPLENFVALLRNAVLPVAPQARASEKNWS